MRWAGKIELHMIENYMFLYMLSVQGIAQQGGGGPYMLYIPYELVFLFLACYNCAISPRRGARGFVGSGRRGDIEKWGGGILRYKVRR